MRLDFAQVDADVDRIRNMFFQEVRRWLESPPPKSWLCSAQCCGKRDLDFAVAREEILRQQILQEQEEVFRFVQNRTAYMNSSTRMASDINILFLTLASPRQVFRLFFSSDNSHLKQPPKINHFTILTCRHSLCSCWRRTWAQLMGTCQ